MAFARVKVAGKHPFFVVQSFRLELNSVLVLNDGARLHVRQSECLRQNALPLRFAMVFSNGLPSKTTIEPSG